MTRLRLATHLLCIAVAQVTFDQQHSRHVQINGLFNTCPRACVQVFVNRGKASLHLTNDYVPGYASLLASKACWSQDAGMCCRLSDLACCKAYCHQPTMHVQLYSCN